MGADEPSKATYDVEATKKEGGDIEAASATPPAYVDDGQIHRYEEEDFWTRNGLSWKSFQRRPASHVELNRTMKTRHMHMIAIGGSIGMHFQHLQNRPQLTALPRCWFLRRIWWCAQHWRTCLLVPRFPDHRCHDFQRRYVYTANPIT